MLQLYNNNISKFCLNQETRSNPRMWKMFLSRRSESVLTCLFLQLKHIDWNTSCETRTELCLPAGSSSSDWDRSSSDWYRLMINWSVKSQQHQQLQYPQYLLHWCYWHTQDSYLFTLICCFAPLLNCIAGCSASVRKVFNIHLIVSYCVHAPIAVLSLLRESELPTMQWTNGINNLNPILCAKALWSLTEERSGPENN